MDHMSLQSSAGFARFHKGLRKRDAVFAWTTPEPVVSPDREGAPPSEGNRQIGRLRLKRIMKIRVSSSWLAHWSQERTSGKWNDTGTLLELQERSR